MIVYEITSKGFRARDGLLLLPLVKGVRGFSGDVLDYLHIHVGSGKSLSAIQKHFHKVDKGTVTKTINTLAEKGYVKKAIGTLHFFDKPKKRK